jgi:glyoxylase-like metal-dependent hydrolase (beta-lactamase superfamily II)
MHTPGHTPADMTYVIGDAAFVGDTLFMPDAGTARADFPGGDAHQASAGNAASTGEPRASGL